MGVQRYTKRPEQIEAIPAHEVLDASEHAWDELPEWIRDAHFRGRILLEVDEVIIRHPAGQLTASGSDMLVYTGQVITKFDAEQFAAAYEPVEPERSEA